MFWLRNKKKCFTHSYLEDCVEMEKNEYESLEFEQENDKNDLVGCVPSEGINQCPETYSLPNMTQSLCSALTIGF